MSDTLTYKMSGRYSMGWTDPRKLGAEQEIGGLRIGNYYLSDLTSSARTLLDIYHKGYVVRARKEEFAAYVEAFLKEKKDGESNTVQRGDEAGLRP